MSILLYFNLKHTKYAFCKPLVEMPGKSWNRYLDDAEFWDGLFEWVLVSYRPLLERYFLPYESDEFLYGRLGLAVRTARDRRAAMREWLRGALEGVDERRFRFR